MDGAVVWRNELVVEESGTTQQTIMELNSDLLSDPSKVTNEIWAC
jgi:hypothetical protein